MLVGITGAKGFIGSYLVRRHAATKPDCRIILRPPPVEPTGLDGMEIIRGDLRSLEDCKRFAENLELIYYLSHANTPVNSDFDQPNDALFNLVPLLNLLKVIEHLRTKPHIVYFSSGGAVYGPRNDKVPYRETDPCVPLSSYGIQKLAAEHYLRLAAHKGHLTAAILRIGNAYGTPLPEYRTQGLIGVAINRVLHGKTVRVFGNLNNVRDYLHLEDICSLVEKVSAPRQSFSIFNASSGEGHSVADILAIIQKCYGAPVKTEVQRNYGDWLPNWVVLDNSKATQVLGWHPSIDLSSGIKRMMPALIAKVAAGSGMA